jgi:hypothetical protein
MVLPVYDEICEMLRLITASDPYQHPSPVRNKRLVCPVPACIRRSTAWRAPILVELTQSITHSHRSQTRADSAFSSHLWWCCVVTCNLLVPACSCTCTCTCTCLEATTTTDRRRLARGGGTPLVPAFFILHSCLSLSFSLSTPLLPHTTYALDTTLVHLLLLLQVDLFLDTTDIDTL